MLRIEEIIIKLSEAGVHMYLDDGKLKSRTFKQGMNSELASIISSNKDRILEYLSSSNGITSIKKRQGTNTKSLHDISNVSPKEYYEASYKQKVTWAGNQMCLANDWNSFFYQTIITVKNVDVGMVDKALDILFYHHEIFRTTVHIIKGELKQKVHDYIPIDYHQGLVDISEAEDQEAEIENIKEKELNKTIDIAKLPFFSARLIKSNDFYYVLLTFDHVCIDLISMKVLKREFSEIYKHLALGNNPELTPPKLHYKDYSTWEHQETYGKNSARHKEYWRELFDGNLDAFNPVKYFCDYHPESNLSYKDSFQKQFESVSHKVDPMFSSLSYGMVPRIFTKPLKVARYEFSVDEALLSSLKILAAEYQVMFSVLIIASINVLLHKLTGQEKAVMSVLSDTRVHESLLEMVGFFAHEVLFLGEVKSDMDIGSVCKLVENQWNASYEHKIYPLTKIASELDISLAGLQTILLNFISVNEKEMEQFTPRYIEGGIAEMGIHLDIREYKNGMVMDCQYSCELFKAETIESIMQYYLSLLNNIVQNPNKPISNYEKHKNYPHACLLIDDG